MAVPNILIADDDEMLVTMWEDVFSRSGYNVRTARDGAAALAALSNQLPNILLLDFEMPHATGLEVLRMLQDYDPAHTVTVILITGRNLKMTGELTEVLERADLTLAKPFSLATLVQITTKFYRTTAGCAV